MGAEYRIYIEDYVLSYLKREVDSLELSEIFFYGKRQSGGKKLLIYGAGREKDIAFFAKYELLNELVCRLTQAGPVFMVRQEDGEYKVSGFQTFYENNEAMQNYLIAWTSGEVGRKAGSELRVIRPESKASFEVDGKKRTGSVMSVQLGLILVVLVAIVISSTNSYRKMERLNQSAQEVFFAIENQEAGRGSGQNDAPKISLADDAGEQEKGTEILVERDTSTDDLSVEDAVRAENARQTEENESAADGSGASGRKDESGQTGDANQAETLADDTETERSEDGNRIGEAGQAGAAAASDTMTQESDAKKETSDGGGAAKEDSSEEALSRNITRYYEVERGDTLYTISQKIYGDASRVEKICEINDISNPDKISEGQKIILP